VETAAWVQAGSTVILVGITFWYACCTKELLRHMQRERQQRSKTAVRAVLLEVAEIARICTTVPQPIHPMELPIQAWDCLKGDLAVLPPDTIEALTSTYSRVRGCNAHFHHWATQITNAGDNVAKSPWVPAIQQLNEPARAAKMKLEVAVNSL
jgi:hypothetical protein